MNFKFGVNQTQISHYILQNTPKTHQSGQKACSSRFFLDFGLENFLALNQKSAMISMFKIHIYIDSEIFRQISLKNLIVGFLVNDTWAKSGFEIWPLSEFLEYFGG